MKELLENDLKVPLYDATKTIVEGFKRPSTASKVKQLYSLAIEDADELLKTESSLIPCSTGGGARDFLQPNDQLEVVPQKSQLDLKIPLIIDLNEEPREYDTTKKSKLGENFEKVVKTVRELEKEGHISEKFRLKFLTLLGLRAGEKERRTIYAYEQVMGDEPNALGQND